MPKGVYNRKPAHERILENIIKDETTGCWLWCGYLDKDGYGQISDAGVNRTTHRTLYEHFNGKVEEGLVMSHLCDEKYDKDSKEYRKCCNPEHLEAITTQENTARMVVLGRSKITEGAFKEGQQVGANNLNAKLTQEDVLEIRRRHKMGLGYGGLTAIAEEYRVKYVTIQKLVAGKTWNKPEFFP